MQTRIQALHHLHACQPRQAAATAEIAQDRLRLILRMMRHEDHPHVIFPRRTLEKSMPRLAGRRLDGNFPFLRQGSHVHLLNLAGQAVLLRQTLHGPGITVRLLTAQTVIQVAEDQFFESRLQQQMQQRHRIPAAGDRQQSRFVRIAGGR